MYHKKGFIVAELLVILFVLVLLAALAVPVFIDSGMSSGETAAVSNVKAVVQAVKNYKAVTGNFPRDLPALANNKPPFLDAVLAGGAKDGYAFSYKVTGQSNFIVVARPQANRGTGVKSFFADGSGTVRWARAEAPLQSPDLSEAK